MIIYPYLGGRWHIWAMEGERVMSTVVGDRRAWHDVFMVYGSRYKKLNFRCLA